MRKGKIALSCTRCLIIGFTQGQAVSTGVKVHDPSVRTRRGLRFRSQLSLVLVCSLPTVTLVAIVPVVSETASFPQRAISSSHKKMAKNRAFVGDTGHFDTKFNLAGSEGMDGLKVDNINYRRLFRLPGWTLDTVIVPARALQKRCLPHTETARRESGKLNFLALGAETIVHKQFQKVSSF